MPIEPEEPSEETSTESNEEPSEPSGKSTQPAVITNGATSSAPRTRRTLVYAILALAVLGVAGGVAAWRLRKSPAKPPWAVGSEVDVELTLVAADSKNLACASPKVVAGHHCAFESKDKAWSGTSEPAAVLRPYTTTDRKNLLAAGLWEDESMKPANLPKARFSVRCKLKIEGTDTPAIRWNPKSEWSDVTSEWFVGTLSGCAVQP